MISTSFKKAHGKSSMVKYITLSKKSISVYADSIGHSNLSNDVLEVLNDDANYRIREILQLSFQLLKKGKRKTLSTLDVKNALETMDIQTIYSHNECLLEKKEYACIDSDLYTETDATLDLLDVTSEQINSHLQDPIKVEEFWLPMVVSTCEHGHMQAYVDHLIKCLQDSDDAISKAAFFSLKSCKQINALMPCIMSYIICKDISKEITSTRYCLLVLKLIEALVSNQHTSLQFNNDLKFIMQILMEYQSVKLNVVSQDDQIKSRWRIIDDVQIIKRKASRLAGVAMGLFTNDSKKMRELYTMKMMRMLDDADDIDMMSNILLSLLHVDIQTLCTILLPKLQFLMKKIEHIHDAFHPFPCKSQQFEKSEHFYNILSRLTLFMELIQHREIKLIQLINENKSESKSLSKKHFDLFCYLKLQTRQLHNVYSMLYELLGDSVTLRLTLQEINSKKKNELFIKLADKELDKSGVELLKMFSDDACQSKEAGKIDETNIKATITDSLHGIKLKISKLPKSHNNLSIVHVSVADNSSLYDSSKFTFRKIFTGSFDKNTLGSAYRNKAPIKLSEAFELIPFKVREDVLIPFRFKGRAILSTFTEKKKAQILARNMARQHASLSKYREMCSTLQYNSRCTPLYKKFQFENYKTHCDSLSSLHVYCPF